jgi:hypothetical protein
MTYEIIKIFVLGSVLNNGVSNVAASNVAASNDASLAAGSRPLARAPDNPSSTR